MKRLNGQPGFSKSAVLPTVIIKEEDRGPLLRWQHENQVPIHIWHNFFDRAFGLPLDRADELIRTGLIEAKEFVYQAPNGISTTKATYFIYYHYAYPLAVSTQEPELIPAFIKDKNGHILPYVRFEGGKLALEEAALITLRELQNAHR